MFVPARVPSLFVLFGRGVASVASAVSRRLERTGGRPGQLRQRRSGRVPFSDVDAPEERSILHHDSEGKPVADRARARRGAVLGGIDRKSAGFLPRAGAAAGRRRRRRRKNGVSGVVCRVGPRRDLGYLTADNRWAGRRMARSSARVGTIYFCHQWPSRARCRLAGLLEISERRASAYGPTYEQPSAAPTPSYRRFLFIVIFGTAYYRGNVTARCSFDRSVGSCARSLAVAAVAEPRFVAR